MRVNRRSIRWGLVAGVLVGTVATGLAQLAVVTLVSGVPFVPPVYSAPTPKLRTHVASSGGRVFWTEGSQTPLKSVPAAGGPIVGHVTKMGAPHDLVVAGADVLFVDQRDGSAGTCTGPGGARGVMRAPLDGSARPTRLAEVARCGISADAIATDGTRAFVVQSSSSPVQSTILAVPVVGGAPVPFYQTSAAIRSLAADASHLYWVEEAIAPMAQPQIRRQAFAGGSAQDVTTFAGSWTGGLAISGGTVYFARDSGVQHSIEKVAASGGTAVPLTTAPNRILALTVDGGTVYWIDATTIRSVPIAGGMAATEHTGLQSPVDLVVAGGHLVWTENRCCPVSGSVMRVPIGGGAAVAVADAPDAPRRLYVHGADVIWAEGVPLAQAPIGAGRIRRAPLAGGAAVTVAGGVSGDTFTPFATDAASLYIADADKVLRVPIAGGPPELLYRGPGGPYGILDIAVADQQVYFLDANGVRRTPAAGGGSVLVSGHAGLHTPVRMAIDATHVYWADLTAVFSAPRTGGAATPLAQNRAAISDMATDGQHVYFSENDSGQILRVPIGGGAVEPVATASAFSPIPIAVDGTDVYWRRASLFEIHRKPKAGGLTTTLATGVQMATVFTDAIVADGQSVVWTEVGSGRIRRAAPPVPPTLALSVNRASLGVGDEQALTVSIAPGTAGSPVDVYLVQGRPDGSFVSLQLDGTRPAGLVPVVRGLTPFSFAGEVWRGPLPADTLTGPHAWLGAFTQPGTLNPVSGIAQAPFVVSPLGPPTSLSTTVNGRTVAFTWLPPATGTPTTYVLEAGTAPGLANLIAGIDIGAATAAAFGGVPPGTYHVRLRARVGPHVSAVSNEVTVVVSP